MMDRIVGDGRMMSEVSSRHELILVAHLVAKWQPALAVRSWYQLGAEGDVVDGIVSLLINWECVPMKEC